MSFLIGLLTLILVLDCVVLVFLVLIQLPKKDAGAGLAFGGAASDALFGAGSGNVLTKITKYAAGIFFVLAIVLSLMQNRLAGRSTGSFSRALSESGKPSAVLPPPSSTLPLGATNVTPPAAPVQAEQPAPAVSAPPASAPTTTNTPSGPQ